MNKCRILVVDDEEGLRITLAANLELEGFEVIEADSGEHALQLLKTEDFDLVLTDIRMPGMSGVDLYRELRQLRKTTPVVLMTAFALEDLIQEALSEGAFTVITKPFAVDGAIRTLQRAAKMPVVLVVDDMPQVATSTAAALSAAGLRVLAVTDPQQALESVKEGNVDLCVVDMVMPLVSGPELVERLKAIDPNVLVIAVSGQDVPEMIRSVVSAGAYTFMRKPFHVPELICTIARARGRLSA
jgi:DNA-binding NtrC family response regulator